MTQFHAATSKMQGIYISDRNPPGSTVVLTLQACFCEMKLLCILSSLLLVAAKPARGILHWNDADHGVDHRMTSSVSSRKQKIPNGQLKLGEVHDVRSKLPGSSPCRDDKQQIQSRPNQVTEGNGDVAMTLHVPLNLVGGAKNKPAKTSPTPPTGPFKWFRTNSTPKERALASWLLFWNGIALVDALMFYLSCQTKSGWILGRRMGSARLGSNPHAGQLPARTDCHQLLGKPVLPMSRLCGRCSNFSSWRPWVPFEQWQQVSEKGPSRLPGKRDMLPS